MKGREMLSLKEIGSSILHQNASIIEGDSKYVIKAVNCCV